jgi:hypothetical protein
MIRDHLAQDFLGSPLPFAKEYYLHYPKVALGAWPPGFHFTEAIWMLLFSPSRCNMPPNRVSGYVSHCVGRY